MNEQSENELKETEATPLATTITVPLREEVSEENCEEIVVATDEEAPVEVSDDTEESENEDSEYELKPVMTADSEEYKKIAAEQTEYLLKRAKESELNWDEVEFEEDGITPIVTEDMLNIYGAITDDFISRDFLDIYIEQCNSFIDSYKEQKSMLDNGMLDTDDAEYFDSVAKGYEDARVILAMLQTESKRIEKEFTEGKIAEHHIKNVSLSSLRDFVVEKFRFTKSWNNPNNIPMDKLDATDSIEKDLLSKMYVTTMYKGYIEKIFEKMCGCPVKYNIFTTAGIQNSYSTLIHGIQEYISNIEDKTNIDLTAIVLRDIHAMNFIKAAMSIAMITTNDEFLQYTDTTPEAAANLKRKLNPEGKLSNGKDGPIDLLAATYKKLVDEVTLNVDSYKLDTFENIAEAYCYLLKNDPIYDELREKNNGEPPYFDDYKERIIDISSLFPEVTGTNVIKWGKYYAYLRKFEMYTSTISLLNTFRTTEEQKDRYVAVVNWISSVATELFTLIYADFIDDLHKFVRENVYSAQSRSTVFSMIMNNLLLQHELGFKTDLNIDEGESNITAPAIYDLAKKVFGTAYEYVVIEEKNDILLKDVNLLDTRAEYITITKTVLETILMGITQCKENTFSLLPQPKVQTKKSQRKRSSKRRGSRKYRSR